jgi:dTMP kinase
LVVIEGIDGAGKSTLLPVLAGACRQRGFECVISREPTDGPWGRKLRESAVTGRLSLDAELELFLQDRREHVAQTIAPALKAGSVVILDRYYFSTAAYQGARGADPSAILAANEQFAPAPDLVLLLDLDPEAGLGRVRVRGDRPNEFERAEELARARAIFQSLHRPGLVRIDAGHGVDEVRRQALEALTAVLERKAVARSASGGGT